MIKCLLEVLSLKTTFDERFPNFVAFIISASASPFLRVFTLLFKASPYDLRKLRVVYLCLGVHSVKHMSHIRNLISKFLIKFCFSVTTSTYLNLQAFSITQTRNTLTSP